jgi:hypothetical protein
MLLLNCNISIAIARTDPMAAMVSLGKATRRELRKMAGLGPLQGGLGGADILNEEH